MPSVNQMEKLKYNQYMKIEDKIRYTLAKIRNIAYYRLEVEPRDPLRYRCQYMHVIRDLKKRLFEIYNETQDQWWLGAANLIDLKVKTDECLDTIYNLRDYVKSREQEN